MQEIFGTSWVNQFGDTPNRTWVEALSGLSDEQIINGLRRTVQEANAFPPNLSVFVDYCKHAEPVECTPNREMYKALSFDPPETDAHRAARKARGAERMAEVKAALRGRA